MRTNQWIILSLFFLLLAPAGADEKVERLFEKVRRNNPGLKDYAAEIKVDIKAWIGVIPYRPSADGTYYYKKPDMHKLKLDNAPGYLKKYPKIFGWNLPNLEKYSSHVEEETLLEGRWVYKVAMLPVQRSGDIERQDIWIDKENFTVPKQITYYEGNGILEVKVSYAQQQGYLVFDRMKAKFNFPKASIEASAEASYSNYRFNQGLEDSFFQDT